MTRRQALLTCLLGSVAMPRAASAQVTMTPPLLRRVMTGVVNVCTDYGAKGDGVTDDTAAIQAAAAVIQARGEGILYFPPGTYRVFGSTTGTLVNWSNLTGVAAIGRGATLQVPTTKTMTTAEGYLFFCSSCTNVVIDGFTTDGPTMDVTSSTVKGYEFAHFEQGCRTVSLPHNTINNMLIGVNLYWAAGSAESYITNDVHIGQLDVRNSWYGVGASGGKNIAVDLLTTDNVHRSLIAYSPTNLTARVVGGKLAGSADVLLLAANRRVLERVDIDYASLENEATSAGYGVQLAFDGHTTPQAMRDVRLRLAVRYRFSSGLGPAFFLDKRQDNGSTDTTGSRGHSLEGLHVSGYVKGTHGGSNSRLTVGHYTPTDWSGETLNKVTFEDLRIETTLEQGFGWPIVQTFDVLTLDRLNTNKAALVFGQGTASNMGTGGQIVVRDVVASNLHDVDGANNNLPLAQIWTPSDATATRSWLNKRISNKGASGTVTVTLPAGTKGDRFLFHRTASHAFRIDPNGSEVIRGGGPGKYLSLDAVGAYVELRWIRNTWEPVAVVGTASFEP